MAFGFVPIMVAGYFYGPVVGGLVGFGADIIGIMINPQGAVHLGFNLSSILTGVIPGLIMLLERNRKGTFQGSIVGAWASTILVTGFVHILLNSVWLSDIFQVPIPGLIVGRLVFCLVEGLLGGIINVVIIKAIGRIDRTAIT